MADLPGSFEETLRARSLALWFESEEVPYTTVGGMAVSLLGRPRATQDIAAALETPGILDNLEQMLARYPHR